VNSELGRQVRVAAVQPGPVAGSDFGTDTKDTPAVRASLAGATRRAAAAGAKLVVWPEEMLTFNLPLATPAQKAWVVRLVRQTGVYLATGYGDPADTYNRAAIITPSGTVLQPAYLKAHPVVLENEDYHGGTAFRSYDTSIGDLGLVICFDYMFLGPVRYTALSGAQLVAAPSWDWGAIAGVRPWDALVFRAVENRVSVVKAERAWDSVIVDATGEVRADTDTTAEHGEAALLVADVHLGPRGSPYLWLGNWTGWLALAGFAALAAGCVRTLRRGRLGENDGES
jgi:apolipoprotein N-acyltransferase